MAEKNSNKSKKAGEANKRAEAQKRSASPKKAKKEGAGPARKPARSKSGAREEGYANPARYQIKLLSFGVFSLLSLFSMMHLPLGALGPFIRSIFTGLFSYGGYALPLFFLLSIMMSVKEREGARKRTYVIAIILMFLAVFYSLALVFSFQMELGFSLSTALDFYEKGINLRGGGLIGSLLFYPLYSLIGRVGLGILIMALIIASLSLITSLNFTSLMSLMGRGLKQGGRKALDAGGRLVEPRKPDVEEMEVLEADREEGGALGTETAPEAEMDARAEGTERFDIAGNKPGERSYRHKEDRDFSLKRAYEGPEEEHILDLFFKPKKVKEDDIKAKEEFRFLELNEKGEPVLPEPARPREEAGAEAQGFQFIDIPKTRKDGSLSQKEDVAYEKEGSILWRNEGYRDEGSLVSTQPAPQDHGESRDPAQGPVPNRDGDSPGPETPKPGPASEVKAQELRDEALVDEAPVDVASLDEALLDGSDLPNSNYYELPSVDMLKRGENTNDVGSLQDIKAKAAILTETFKSFKVDCEVVSAERGPMITRFEVRPMPGVKISKIAQLNDDIALKLAATQVRILAPIPGKAAVGIEVPNEKVSVVRLRDVLESEDYRRGDSLIRFGLGKDISGKDIVPDLAKMPHLLIAGATGSGKSVCVNTIIASILFNSKPDEVKFLMIDPKVVELGIYNGIAHLLLPVVTDATKASVALSWAVNEMTRRYNVFASTKCKDITSYNEKVDQGLIEEAEPMPRIVIIIDELADLMMVAQKQVEDSIARIAQMARAAGMHLIVATQRPSVDVITGVIKANIPSRIAFAVSSHIDSRTIIDEQGAEKLLGKGDMLFLNAGKSKPTRVQGAFITDHEIEALVNYIKAEAAGEPVYDETVVDAASLSMHMDKPDMESDSLLNAAIAFAISSGKCSTSMIQRKFKIGYNRAARIVEEMEERGVVGPANGAKPREIINSAYQVDEDFISASDMED